MQQLPIPPIEVGQTFPPYEPPSIYLTDTRGEPIGGPRWHALRVFPQKERATKAWLGLWQVDAFYPVEIRKRWRRNQMIPYEATYLPGFVFAKFPGEPCWHTMIGDDRRLIRDVLRMSDGVTPGKLHPDTLVRLKKMRDMDAAIEERRRLRRTLRRGDKAKLVDGPLIGHTVEIVEVNTAGRAKFELMLFGRISDGDVDVEMLKKVE